MVKLVRPRVALVKPRIRTSYPEQPTTYGQGRGGRPWRRLRAQVLERDGYLCQCEECKALDRMLLAQEVDHIVPRVQGGTDDPSNLRAINRDCHEKKTRLEAAEARGRGGSKV